MKTLITVFVLSATSVLSQNVAIAPLLARPEHEFNAVPGCPTNWPVIVDRLGTNAASPFPGRSVITEGQLSALYQSIGPAFTNWHTTAWANYNLTNTAAIEGRRTPLAQERDAIENFLRRQTNAVDYSALNLPTLVSNLIRLQTVQEKLSTPSGAGR